MPLRPRLFLRNSSRRACRAALRSIHDLVPHEILYSSGARCDKYPTTVLPAMEHWTHGSRTARIARTVATMPELSGIGQESTPRGENHRRQPQKKHALLAIVRMPGPHRKLREISIQIRNGDPLLFPRRHECESSRQNEKQKGRCQTTPAMRSSETSSEQCSRSAKNDHDQRAETSSGIPGLIVDAMEALVM